MFDYPKTLKEAKEYKYNQWAGNSKGNSYVNSHCAYEIWINMLPYQCSRKNGYGPEMLYCWQHAKKLK